jgi:putative PIN family toxin of toxin-antitoxin system
MGTHNVFTSRFVLNEFGAKLLNKFKYSKDEIEHAERIVLSGATITEEAPHKNISCRDKDDFHILAAAINADVDCIISGDEDLLSLKKVYGIPIIKPRDFWKFEEDFAIHN